MVCRAIEIPLLARIVSVVDVFDALTTDRPYRVALAPDAAYQVMRDEQAAGWCDRVLLDAFIDLDLPGGSSTDRVDESAPAVRV